MAAAVIRSFIGRFKVTRVVHGPSDDLPRLPRYVSTHIYCNLKLSTSKECVYFIHYHLFEMYHYVLIQLGCNKSNRPVRRNVAIP